MDDLYDDSDVWTEDDELRWMVTFVESPTKRSQVGERTPFLLAPDGSFDIVLNQYFSSEEMILSSKHTRMGYARDLAQFFSFVATAKADPSSGIWRDVSRSDRKDFAWWRNVADDGPRVAASTWNRGSAAALSFYTWALSEGHVAELPFKIRYQARSRRGVGNGGASGVTERRKGGSNGRMVWMDKPAFRAWRDVGVRGFSSIGLPGSRASRSMSGRDAAYVDFMVRTGLRLEEQSSLLVSELPERNDMAFRTAILPSVIAKNGSGRKLYLADDLLAKLEMYCRSDRAWSVNRARKNGTYVVDSDTWLVDPDNPKWAVRGRLRRRLNELTSTERIRTLKRTPQGLEPASLWLTKDGTPMTLKGWQGVFERASARCAKRGLELRASPHTLRHSFAVATLEQLQRGYNDSLAEKSAVQRRHYRSVWGDPLDTLRVMLGHRSAETTAKYLHLLLELDMEARFSLLGEDWGLPMGVADGSLVEHEVGAG